MELQDIFTDAMLKQPNESDNLKTCIVAKDEIERERRLEVYTQGYRNRLLALLQMDFPVTQAMAGYALFDDIVHHYISSVHSQHFLLRRFTQGLADFIVHHYEEHLALAEMARFEWLFEEVTLLADAPVITLEHLKRVPQERWEDMYFVVHPSVQLFTSYYNTAEIWQAIMDQQPQPVTIKYDEPAILTLWRMEHMANFYVNTAPSARLFQMLMTQKTFPMMCEALLAFYPESEVANHALEILLGWINDHVIADILFTSL